MDQYQNHLNSHLSFIEDLYVDNKINEAIIELLKYADLNRSVDSLILLGNCYLKTDPIQNKKALECYKKAENLDKDNNTLAKFNIGLLFYSLGELPNAIKYLKEASEKDPNNIKIRFKLGN